MKSNQRNEGFSRREALKGMAAASVVTLAGCERSPGAYEQSQPPPPPSKRTWDRRQERWVKTTCGQCAAGCSIDVRVVEGRAVSVKGVDSPINRGGVGPRGIASLQALYDPDRIATPLMRAPGLGPRQQRPLKPVTWDTALEAVATPLRKLHETNLADSLITCCGRDRGMMQQLWRRFANGFGTANHFEPSAWSMGALPQAMQMLTGVNELPGYDWQNLGGILTLGSGVLETACQRVYFLRAAADFSSNGMGRRAHIIHADPCLPSSTTISDEWLPIRPCSHGLLALAICNVLIRDKLVDPVVTAKLQGFEDDGDTKGFRSWVLAEFSPRQVAVSCGITAEEIEKTARSLAKRHPAVAIIDPAATLHKGGLQTARAVLSLNALLGAFHRQNGALHIPRPLPLSDWPAAATAQAASEATVNEPVPTPATTPKKSFTRLPETILAGDQPNAQALLLYYSNPVYSDVAPQRWKKALERVPLVVSFSPYLDETAAEFADVILPDHTVLERWEDGSPAPAGPDTVFVVQPRHDTRATGDVLIELAAMIGDDLKSALPFKNFRKAMRQQIGGLGASGRGSFTARKKKSFRKKLRKKGFWVDDTEQNADGPQLNLTGSGGPTTLPASLTTSLDGSNLWLLPYTPSTYATGSGANQSWLVSLGEKLNSTPIEINPDTASRLGITDGDRVEVTTKTGIIVATAVLFGGIRPDCVRIPRGGGHTNFGRWAKDRGGNVNELLAADVDAETGLADIFANRVKLRRVS